MQHLKWVCAGRGGGVRVGEGHVDCCVDTMQLEAMGGCWSGGGGGPTWTNVDHMLQGAWYTFATHITQPDTHSKTTALWWRLHPIVTSITTHAIALLNSPAPPDTPHTQGGPHLARHLQSPYRLLQVPSKIRLKFPVTFWVYPAEYATSCTLKTLPPMFTPHPQPTMNRLTPPPPPPPPLPPPPPPPHHTQGDPHLARHMQSPYCLLQLPSEIQLELPVPFWVHPTEDVTVNIGEQQLTVEVDGVMRLQRTYYQPNPDAARRGGGKVRI